MTVHGKGRSFTGRSFLFLDEVDSTNSLVLRRRDLLATPGLVVCAERQLKGRGRKERAWYSSIRGNLYASLVIHPSLPQGVIPCITILAGLAVFRALCALGLERLGIKWPNDVLVRDRKVCGILSESRHTEEGRIAVVVGVGINIRGGPEDFPPELRPLVTTLEKEGITAERDRVLELLLDELDDILVRVHGQGPGWAFRAWEEASCSLGRTVSFQARGQGLRGRIQGLDENGRLLVAVEGGGLIPVSSGEITYATTRMA